jgi:cobalt-zinc-cadmium efflux system protein
LTIAFALVVVFMVVEAVVAFLTGSLALLSDAGHMATDALGLGMSLAAVVAADKGSRRTSHTFGIYRVEILAALANTVLLLAVSGYVIWEAVVRLQDPVEMTALPVLVVATIGLVVNLISWRLLRQGAAHSLNIRGAYLEVSADLVGSVGVILAALVTLATGWAYADPLVAAGIGLLILPRAWRLGAQAVRILIQAAPPGVDIEGITQELRAISGVEDVHDLHLWTLTSAMEVATAHIVIGEDVEAHPVLDSAREVLEGRHGIDHATLQVEPASHRDCLEANW